MPMPMFRWSNTTMIEYFPPRREADDNPDELSNSSEDLELYDRRYNTSVSLVATRLSSGRMVQTFRIPNPVARLVFYLQVCANYDTSDNPHEHEREIPK